MRIEEHLSALRAEGERLGDVAARMDVDASIPTCPEWRMRDLLRHIGDVHRWAAAHVGERRLEPIRDAAGVAEVAGPLPDDEDLLTWYRDGHAHLVKTLETADPDVQCWSFLPAPSALAFWARRQAHETTIHRADAESAAGPLTPVSTAFGLDGIDELLFGFLGRTPDPQADVRTVRLTPTDADRRWLVRVGSDSVGAARSTDEAEGDTEVRGPASDLYLLLWNRLDREAVDVRGDPSALTTWRDTVTITWGRPR